MKRRTFIQASSLAALGTMMSSGLHGFSGSEIPFETANPSLTLNFALLQVQKLIAYSQTGRPEVEQVIKPDASRAVSGNAFLAGKYGLAAGESLKEMVADSYTKFDSNRNASESRKLFSFSLGNLTAASILGTFERGNAAEYLAPGGKSAALDALILHHFYLKNQDLAKLDVGHIKQLLQTLVTRTLVKYHTLKVTEKMPMEWIEEMIAFSEKSTVHFDAVAENLKTIENNTTPRDIFNPEDKFLLDLSPFKNKVAISAELLGDFTGVPTMFCVVSKAILNATKSLLDYRL